MISEEQLAVLEWDNETKPLDIYQCRTLIAEIRALRKIKDAAKALRKHWNDEYAHFACGGEAILLEALAAYESSEEPK